MTASASSRVAIVVLFAALLAPAAAATTESGMRGLRVEPPKAIRGEALVDHDGRRTRFPLTERKWQLAFFGYTHCPDVCPMTLHKARILLNHLGADAGRLQVLFLSIDTPRDHPEQVKKFVQQHDPRVRGLTGDAAAVQAVANEFGVLTRRFQGKTALSYTLEHSSFLYLLDPQGRVRVIYPGTVEPQDIARDLRVLWQAPAG